MPKFNFTHFKSIQDPTVLKKEMLSVVREMAGKGDVHYVAVKNYKTPKSVAPMSLFLVVDNPNEFIAHMKDMKLAPDKRKDKNFKVAMTGLAVSHGSAEVTKNEKGEFKVLVKDHTGDLSANIISSSVVKPALNNDSKIMPTTPEREQAEIDNQTPSVRKSPEMMAKESLNKALKEGAALRKAGADMSKPGLHQLQNEMPAAEYLDMLGKQREQIAEFMKFASAYRGLANKYNFEDNSLTIPGQVWLSLIKNMKDSGYKPTAAQTGPDGRFYLRVDGPDGEKVREELLEKGMRGMQAFITHAENNLDKVVKAVLSNQGKSWAFWSGVGAKNAAKKEAGGGLVLEGSIGSWFDEIWEFKHLTGVEDMVLWSAMSELYARKAAEYYQQFSFVGFMGPGSTKETTVWTNIEKPAIIEVLTVQKQVPIPKIRWYVVDCVWDATLKRGAGDWRGTGDPSAEFPNRGAAEAEVKRRYTE